MVTLFKLGSFSFNSVFYFFDDQINPNKDRPFQGCLVSLFFHQKSAIFVISRNTNVHWILIYNFSFFYFFFESLKIFLINIAAILMRLAKLATLGLPKDILKKRFWCHKFCLWCHQQNLIKWLELYCGCSHVTKVWYL